MLCAVGGDHDHVGDIPDGGGVVAAQRVQNDRRDGVDHRVLLHIQQKEVVHGAFKEFPQHADGHGEAERHQGQEQRGQRDGESFASVEDIHQGEADGGAEEPVEGVEHGVPVGERNVVRLDLPQNFCGEDKEEDDDLQRVRQVDVDLSFNKGRDQKQNQREDTEKHIFKVTIEKLGHHHKNDQDAQDHVERGHALFLLDLLSQGHTASGKILSLSHHRPPSGAGRRRSKSRLFYHSPNDDARDKPHWHRMERGDYLWIYATIRSWWGTSG